MNNDLIRENRALAIIDRLTDSKVINIRERGILRRAILLPKKLQGEWKFNTEIKIYQCSYCKVKPTYTIDNGKGAIPVLSNFCPNCGTKMQFGGTEE